jgi:hypothetical protein
MSQNNKTNCIDDVDDIDNTIDVKEEILTSVCLMVSTTSLYLLRSSSTDELVMRATGLTQRCTAAQYSNISGGVLTIFKGD